MIHTGLLPSVSTDMAFKLREHYLTSAHPTLQNPDGVPEEFDDPNDHRALAFEYFNRAYAIWLDLIDDLTEPKQYLEDRYGLMLSS